MSRFFAAAIFLLLVNGCSAPKEILKVNKTESEASNAIFEDSSKSAMEQFINGSIAETKGDLSTAISYYLQALKLDSKPGIYYALAKDYLNLNKLPQALEYSKKAVALDSTKIDYFELLSDIYTNARQNDSAAVVLSKIISMDSSNVEAYYKLARIYETNRPAKAISIYQTITNIIGPDWNVLMHVSELQAGQENFKDAAASVKQILTLDPGNAALKKLLAEYYQRAKMYDEAVKVIDDVLVSNPDDLDAHDRKAQIYLSENKWDTASEEYSYILKQHNVPLDLKIRIGATYFERSLKDSSLLPVTKDFFKTIDKDTANWQVKMYLGAIALNEKNDPDAIENFKAATQLASWNVEAWVRLGGLYFDNKKYDEAEKVLHEAVIYFPEDFRVNLILGLSFAQLNKNAEAKVNLKKAVELNPKDVTAISAYGYTLSQLKENDEAVVYIKRALSFTPEDANLLGTLGLIYDGQKKWNECDSVYEKALSIDSSSALLNNNFAYSLSERGIKLDRALRMAKIAIKAEPDNSAYLDTIGWIYFKAGDFNSAIEYIQKALKVGGEKPDILEHLGDIQYKMGERDKAKSSWQKALDLDKNNIELKQKIEKGEN
ncbi:MAG: tetratricopeptide repeat protein [Ignavibacteriaceae bacterium]|nr:tetratricopeptide repeat protein [Ignavibacteriaceae bacterium]